MTADPDRPSSGSDASPAAGREKLDLEDLRFENARLRASIAERQVEIEQLSKRLGQLQAQVATSGPRRLAASVLNGLDGLRHFLRRRG